MLLDDKIEYNLVDFIKDLAIYNKYHIDLADKITGSDDVNAVRLMTVHGAKGQEYEHVFIIRCQSKKWGDSPGKNRIKLPFGLLKNQFVSEEDDEERRLFYVAMTRAKYDLTISYSKFSTKQTNQQPSRFIKEIPEDKITFTSLIPNPETDNSNQVAIIENATKETYTEDAKAILNNLVSGLKLNVSQLIAYRKCPRCFYFNNILKVPSLKNKASSYGSAVHTALYNFAQMKKEGKIQTEDEFISSFVYSLKSERLEEADFLDSLEKGEHILRDYCRYSDYWENRQN